MIDLLDYLRGDGRLYELVNNLGSNEITQTQTEPGNVFFHVKNSQWEELWADDVFIYRGTDTSPGGIDLYMLSENNHYGSAWVPRWFEIGQLFKRTAVVMWRNKRSGGAVPEKPTGTAVTYLRLERIYSQLTFQSGIQLQDVAELHAYVQDGDHPASSPWEKYFYAKGFGLVGFEDMYGGFKSWIAQKFTPNTMTPRVREVIGWLTPLQKRYYLPIQPTTIPAGQFITDISTDWVNIRDYPNVYGKDVGDLRKNDVVTLFTPEAGDWVKVKSGNVQGWVSRQNGKVVFTSTDAPAPPPPTLPQVKAVGQYTLTQLPASWVNVRDYPNESGHDLGDLHKDDVMTLFTPEVDGWVYIDAGDLEGWVWRQGGKVGFTAVPGAPEPPIPPDDLPPVPVVTPSGQYALVQIPSTWVNVRAYPDTVGADVGDLRRGDIVTLYTPEVNDWVFIVMGDVRGWVSKQGGKVAFSPVVVDSPIPHDDLPPPPQVTPRAGQYALSELPGTWVNIRAYPDTVGADVGDLHRGDRVTLYTPEVNDWVFIETGDVHGWVARQNGRVVFEQVTTASGVPANGAAQAAEFPNGSEPEPALEGAEDGDYLGADAQQVEGGVMQRFRSEIGRIINRKRD